MIDKPKSELFNYFGHRINCGKGLWEFDDCTRKGKPAVKRGHKAVNLPALQRSVALETHRGRLSGCRRRSEKVNGSTSRDEHAGQRLGHLARPANSDHRACGDGKFGAVTGTTCWRRLFCHRWSRTLRHTSHPFQRQLGSTFSASESWPGGAAIAPPRPPIPTSPPPSRFPSSQLRQPFDADATDKGTPAAMRVRKARSLGKGLPRSSGYRRSLSRD